MSGKITTEEWLAEYERIEDNPDKTLYKKAVAFVIDNQSSSVGKLTAALSVGDHTARRLVCQMETDGIVGKYRPGRSRVVLLRKKKGI